MKQESVMTKKINELDREIEHGEYKKQVNLMKLKKMNQYFLMFIKRF